MRPNCQSALRLLRLLQLPIRNATPTALRPNCQSALRLLQLHCASTRIHKLSFRKRRRQVDKPRTGRVVFFCGFPGLVSVHNRARAPSSRRVQTHQVPIRTAAQSSSNPHCDAVQLGHAETVAVIFQSALRATAKSSKSSSNPHCGPRRNRRSQLPIRTAGHGEIVAVIFQSALRATKSGVRKAKSLIPTPPRRFRSALLAPIPSLRSSPNPDFQTKSTVSDQTNRFRPNRPIIRLRCAKAPGFLKNRPYEFSQESPTRHRMKKCIETNLDWDDILEF